MKKWFLCIVHSINESIYERSFNKCISERCHIHESIVSNLHMEITKKIVYVQVFPLNKIYLRNKWNDRMTTGRTDRRMDGQPDFYIPHPITTLL